LKSLLPGLVFAVALFTGAALPAAETIPPAPARHFNDYAGIISAPTAAALDQQLAQYERDSSNQLLVAIYPKMDSDSSVEDFTVRTASAWKAGQSGRNNGAVLFAFMQEHKLYLQVGYGLEPVLTDAIASQIIQNELKPAFRAGDYDGGMRAAVQSMIAATKGEYQGTGRTQAESHSSRRGNPLFTLFAIIIFLVIMVINAVRQARHPGLYTNPRRIGGIFWGGGGGGGGWSNGGGGGGGFSGGGGSFGGGGAGGSW
jgi:uncharacterized protein